MKTYAPFPARYHALVARRPGSVLLQTSRFDRENFRSYLFIDPAQVLRADACEQLPELFQKIEDALRRHAYVAGFLSYESGEGFERILGTAHELSWPLAWFGVYPKAFMFDHRTGSFAGESLPPPHHANIGHGGDPDALPGALPLRQTGFEVRNLQASVTEEDYLAKVERIREYIRAGDVYQVNLTHTLRLDFRGDPAALFTELSARQPVSYGAFLNLGDSYVLSLSPELFFRMSCGQIITRPMKGTARRGRDLAEDAAQAEWLRNDPKNRSENLMIVDLLRNDLGRICNFGSVRVEDLFAVEKYETLFQMTSTIRGDLRPEVSREAVFRAIFPCGSVTGAPKIRAMEIIRELEPAPRGIYTGAIGFFAPESEAVFNVPIRTVVLRGDQGEMGVGSGIVIDSVARDEYGECLLKAEFLTRREPRILSRYANSGRVGDRVQLIESILWHGEYKLLELHLQRLQSSAAYLGFEMEREAVLDRLQTEEKNLRHGKYKVRLLLDAAGDLSCEVLPVGDEPPVGKIMIATARTSSGDRFLRHKTTRRELYDQWLAVARQQGYDDVIFLNERDEVTEAAISNLFIEKAGQWFTPPVACGLLPGVYRRHVLETNTATEEKALRLYDLKSADAIYLCNAVRGLRRVVLR